MAIAEPLAALVDRWYLGQTRDSRALPAADLHRALEGIAVPASLHVHAGVDEALTAAREQALPGDCILVFGSFTTVEAALLQSHEEATAI